MNWEAIGAVGDAAGGIGVVVSLVYLAIQTRSNTRAIQSASFHEVNASFAEISMAISLDAEMTELIGKALKDAPELTETERARFGFFALSFFRRAESMFFQSEQGTLQHESWMGLRSTLRAIVQSREGRDWWTQSAERFNPRFREFVLQSLIQDVTGA